MIKIDKDVPLPAKTGATSKYPLPEMDIGDSFFAPNKTVNTLTGAFSPHKPKKFSARTVTENGVKGVRVWRVA